jgi:hypothetical protein
MGEKEIRTAMGGTGKALQTIKPSEVTRTLSKFLNTKYTRHEGGKTVKPSIIVLCVLRVLSGKAVYTNPKTEVQSPHDQSQKREASMYTTEGKKIVITDKAPKAIGPYSQAISTDTVVYTAGQIGLDPATMDLLRRREAQARRALTNLKHV